MENIHKLRESVLEAITGVIQGMKENEPQLQQGLQQYTPAIMAFLQMVNNDEDCPIEVTKAATGVLGCDLSPLSNVVSTTVHLYRVSLVTHMCRAICHLYTCRDICGVMGPMVKPMLGQEFVGQVSYRSTFALAAVERRSLGSH